MRTPWFRRFVPVLLPAVLAISALPAVAANNVPDEIPEHDGRLEGYFNDAIGGPKLLMLPESGAAGAWFLTIVLGGLCFGVMCKGGKRTHLD